jgi:hypothetical protein
VTHAGLGATPSPSSDTNAIFPLLCGQRWLTHVLQHEPTFARPVQRIYRLRRPVDTSALLAAFRYVVSAHPSLRLNLTGGTGQRFLPIEAEIAGVAVRGRTPRVRAAYARSILAADAERPFDLTSEPPFLAKVVEVDGEHYLGLALDHLAADERAADILEVELAEAYARESCGEPHPPVRVAAFIEYLKLEPTRRASEVRNLEWWVSRLAGAPLAPVDGDHLGWVPGQTRDWELSGHALRELEASCRALRCSVFSALLAAQAELLCRAAQKNDVVINVPVSNRVRPAEHTWIANLSMLLHLRLRLPTAVTSWQWVTYVRDQLLDAMAHRQVDYSELSTAVADEAASRGGRVHWIAGSSFVDARATPPVENGVLAERLDDTETDLISVPGGSCAFTARRSADHLRVSVVWDPARLLLGAALLQEDYLATLGRLTGADATDLASLR